LIFRTLSYFIRSSFQLLKNLSKTERLLLYLLLFANIIIKLILLVKFPIFVDEAWTFFNFTNKGFAVSASHYPAPNNHILHSLLSNITYHFPFGRTINLRLPNFLVNITSILVFFIVFAKLFDSKIALIFSSVFSFSFPMLYYGYVARGYTLIVLFYLPVFYAAIRIIQKNEQESITKYLILISTAGVFGFYTMPSFLYPYASTLLFLAIVFVQNKAIDRFKKLIISGIATSIFVIALYMPVFMTSGIDAVTGNRYVKSINLRYVLANMPHHFNDTSLFLTYLPVYISLPIFVLLLIKIRKNKQNTSLQFAVFSIAITPFILLAHRVVPFARTWIYLLIPMLFLLGLFFRQQKKLLTNNSKTIAITTVFVAFQAIYGIYAIGRYDNVSFEISQVSDYLLSKKVKQIYVGENAYLGTNLSYIYDEKHPEIMLVEKQSPISEADQNKYKYFLVRENDAEILEKNSNFIKLYTLKEKEWIHYVFERKE
jgi:hypothetical protein